MELLERVFEAGHGRVRYVTSEGDGPPLLLCHGFLGSAENFRHWIGAIGTRRRLIIPDLPGFGASHRLPWEHSSERLACEILAIMDHEGVGTSFDLGGLCLGADTAMAVAALRPEAVHQIILHTPLLAPQFVRRRFHMQAAMLTAAGVYPSIVWLSRQKAVSDLYKRFVVEGPNVDIEEAELNFRNQCLADPRAAREWLRTSLRASRLSILRSMNCPTLLMAARNDRILNVERLVEEVKDLDQLTLAIFEDAGHGWDEAFITRQLIVITAFLDGESMPNESWLWGAAS